MSQEKKSTSKKGKVALGVGAGILAGAAAGFAAGILTAPKSGKETRADLKIKAGKLKVSATKKAKSVVSKTGDIVEDVKDEAIDLKQRVGRAGEGAKKGFFDDKK